MTERNSEEKILEILQIKINQKYKNFEIFAQEMPDEFKKIKSKSGGKYGRPEFVILFNFNNEKSLLIIECKKKITDHEKAKKEVIHYMQEVYNLNKKINVYGISFSGLEVNEYDLLEIKNDHINELTKQKLTINEIINNFIDPQQRINEDKLNNDLKDLNIKFLGAGVGTSDRGKILTSIIASFFVDSNFYKNYEDKDTQFILDQLKHHTKKWFKDQQISADKIDPYCDAINASVNTLSIVDKHKIIEILEIWDKVSKNIKNTSEKGLDITGKFFNEFLRYGTQDKKGKGQVLTPDHFAKLMVNIAQIQPTHKVLDIACGTGAFLVHALRKMLKEAESDEQRKNIRENGVWGNDSEYDMTLNTMLNLVLHGDGKSNVHHGNALNLIWQNNRWTPKHTPHPLKTWINNNVKGDLDRAILNPPYHKTGVIPPELFFIFQSANFIKKNGIVVAIHPLSVLLGNKYKEERMMIMKKHTLLATMIAPKELFNAGVETAISIWEAHKPHNITNYVYFADWTKDGFYKVKNKHRQDLFGEWKFTYRKWINEYEKKIEIPNHSVYVNNIDSTKEWTLWPYVKADYNNLNFEETIRKYISFLIEN